MAFLTSSNSLSNQLFSRKRPTYLRLDLDSKPKCPDSDRDLDLLLLPPATDSGYSTTYTTPVDEDVPPHQLLDIGQLCAKLEPLGLGSGSGFRSEPEPKPIDIITPPGPNQNVGHTVVFWIHSQPNAEFNVIVSSPSGLNHPVTSELHLDLGQHKVCFEPIEPGHHSVSVFRRSLGSDEKPTVQVAGSPFPVQIGRDYALASTSRPVIRIDMELIEDNEMLIERKPWGLALNTRLEQLIVTDREQHEVLIYHPDGTPHLAFGGFGSDTGKFKRPTGVAYNHHNDHIYVTDKDNHRVQVFSATGGHLFSFGKRGKGNGEFCFPWGIAVSGCGALIAIADSRNHRLQLFRADGTFLRKYSDGGKLIEYPRGVTFDVKGENVYVSDFNLHHVARLDISFTSAIKIIDDTQLKRPQGLFINSAGQLFVSNSRQNTIKIFNPQNGRLLQEITQVSTQDLDLPLNMLTMPAGFLVILDLNGRITVF